MRQVASSRHQGINDQNMKTKQGGCCCWQHNRMRVAPEDFKIPGYELVKLSENRIIQVKHVNPKSRDIIFESQTRQYSLQESDSCVGSSPLRQNHTIHENGNSSSVTNSPSHSAGAGHRRTKSAGPTKMSRSPQHTPNKLKRTNTATSVIVDVTSKVSSPSRKPSLPAIGDDEREKSKTIFMLHGVGGSSDVWQAQIDYFQDKGYELIVPDFLGHGFSSAPKESKEYTFNSLAQDILQIFDKYCKRQSVLIGHSYG